MKLRLDLLLVERALTDSREKAKALILAGQVLVNDQKIDKAGTPVSTDARVEILQQLRYVSRGGLKLESALQVFAIDLQQIEEKRAHRRVCVGVLDELEGRTPLRVGHH